MDLGRSLSHLLHFLLFAAAIACGKPADAVPADQILPATTKGYVCLTNAETATANWQQTQLGKLVADEAMKPFFDDLRQQLDRKLATMQKRIGLTFEDIHGIASGETALAIVHSGEGQAAVALVVDFAGNEARLATLLKKLDTNLVRQRAKKNVLQQAATPITTYTIPPAEGETLNQELALFVREKQLCSASSIAVAVDMLAAFEDGKSDRLANLVSYSQPLKRCTADARNRTPDVEWFIDPFGFSKAYRLLDKRREKKTLGKDLAKILESQGFDAIQGVAGQLHFFVQGNYEMLHRTAVFAPPVAEAAKGEKYLLAMRMLDLPVRGPLEPQTWIPRDVATYASFNLNIPGAFDASETLVDEYIGHKGAFVDALHGIRDDPFGPKVDIREELVAHLGDRVTAITDYELPITPSSERFLFAIETRDERALAVTIEKLMQKDPYARRHTIEGRVIWEIAEDSEMSAPSVEFGDDEESDLFDSLPSDDGLADEEDAPSFPKSVVCVSDDHLYFASNLEFLLRILAPQADTERLTYEADYALVQNTLADLAPGGRSVVAFSRTDEEYRPAYELLRQGKMPESETILGRILNEFLTEDDDIVRQQKFDGSKLPEFEMVRRYFGPSGLAITSEATGWFVSGALLNKNAAVNVAARPDVQK